MCIRDRLEGMQYYLDQVSEDIEIMEMENFGDFWRAREAQDFTTTMTNGQLTIQLMSELDMDHNLGLVVSNGQALMSIVVFDEDGNQVEKTIENRGTEDVIVFFQEDVISAVEEIAQLNQIEIFPIPTTGEFNVRLDWPNSARLSMDVYDIYGKKISQLMDETVSAMQVQRKFSFLDLPIGSGIYFLVVRKDRVVFGREKIVFY